MDNKADRQLQQNFVRVAQPAYSLVFEIGDPARARDFYTALSRCGAITPESGTLPAAIPGGDLSPLLDLLEAYGVTVAREFELLQKDLAPGEKELEELLAHEGGRTLIGQGLTRFWATAKNPADLLRLHCDLSTLASREREWLRPLSFRENAPLLTETVDEAVARLRAAMDFSIRIGENSFMLALGPEKQARTGLRVADDISLYCRPGKEFEP